MGLVYLYYMEIQADLPDVSQIKQTELQVPMRIYSADGKLISEVGTQRRYVLEYEDIPQQLLDALVSIEDARFFHHFGVDVRGLIRAAVAVISSGEKSQGASTITMQLARNFYLTRAKSYDRKVREILIALRLEQLLSKEDIITLYMNKVFLGYRSYGFESAAQTYYGKTSKELTLAEAAMLAGLPKAPSAYNPIVNPTRAKQRRDHILSRMLALGKITKDEYEAARISALTAQRHGANIELDAGHAAELARVEAQKILGKKAYIGGYNVFLTLQSKAQEAAASAVVSGITKYNYRHAYPGAEHYVVLPNDQIQWKEEDVRHALDLLPKISGLERAVVVAADDQQVRFNIEVNKRLERITLSADQLKWATTYRPTTKGLTYQPLYPETTSATSEQYPIVTTEQTTVLVTGTTVVHSYDENGFVIGAHPIQVSEYVSTIQYVVTDLVPVSTQVTLANGDTKQRIILTKQTQSFKHYPPNRKAKASLPLKEILSEGALVYLQQVSGEWRLSTLPQAQGALVSLDARDGSVLALVGGFNFRDYKYNRVVQANRQPGSNFKPFVYAAALSKGFSAASIINDAPVTFENSITGTLWQPSNYSGKYFGPTRLREGLVHSRNLVSVRLMHQTGVGYTINYLKGLGFDAELFKGQRNLSIALGSIPISPMKVAEGYSLFANGGYGINHYLVDRIENAQGEIVYQAEPATVCNACDQQPTSEAQQSELLPSAEPSNVTGMPIAPRVMDEGVAYIMSDVLRSVVGRGTGRRARNALRRDDIGGKTGTTNQQFDAWFSGYAGHVVTTVWFGKDRPETLGLYETGSRAALPIWIDYMKVALQDMPEVIPPKPRSIVSVRINPRTGLTTEAGQQESMFELFRSENIPAKQQSAPDEVNSFPSINQGKEKALRDELF